MQFESLQPEQCGVSARALDAAKAIMSLDGLAPFRRALADNSSYDVRAAVADWARRIDLAWKIADAAQSSPLS